MVEKIIKIDLSPQSTQLIKTLKDKTDKEKFLKALDAQFKKEANLTKTHIVRNFLSGNPLKRRSGNLAKSIVGSSLGIKSKTPGYKIGVLRGPSLAYASTQEFGTKGKNPDSPISTITPKRAKALAMPLGPALTRAGVRRRESPKDWENLKFIPFRNSGVAVGALYDEEDLAEMKEAGLTLRSIPAYYLLLRKVDINPVFYISKSVDARLPKTVANINKAIQDFFKL